VRCHEDDRNIARALVGLKALADLVAIKTWSSVLKAWYSARMFTGWSATASRLEGFERATPLSHCGGYARRDRGGTLLACKVVDEAALRLRLALQFSADGPQATFGLSTALVEIGTRGSDAEADSIFLRSVKEHPNSPTVQDAELARIAFADRRLT
jgi:hypothetical protein